MKTKEPTSFFVEPSYGVIIKTKEEILLMRRANLIAAQILNYLEQFIIPGVTTESLNREVEKQIYLSEGTSAMRGHSVNGRPWPAVICASVNEEVGHGVPSSRILVEGDIIGIDLCIDYKGWKADTARTYPVGEVSVIARQLIETTRRALYAGIEKMVPGNYLRDVSLAVQARAETEGFSLVRDYSGHGIGRNIHEPPCISNYDTTFYGPLLKPGMVLALEPMVNIGTWKITHRGPWTIVTKDNSLSAHWEHSVAITKDGPWILSEL